MDVFVSDIHLGTKDCRCGLLDAWLKENKKNIQSIYLVGDIVDMWRLRHKTHWPQSHIDFIRRILSFSKAGKSVYYIIGNHDGHLNNYTNGDLIFELGNIKVCRTTTYHNYLVLHGDQFDPYKTLAKIGDWIYGIVCIFVKRAGKSKNKVKKFFQDKVDMRGKAIRVAESGNYKGVICGHTHVPEISEQYINCGDMIENFTIVVFEDGKNPRIVHLT